MRIRKVTFPALLALQAACSSSGTSDNDGGTAPPHDGSADHGGSEADRAPTEACDGGTCIQHLVVIVQENHTFDDHFGAYCTATPGSNPTCNAGPSCCEAMPAMDPSGHAPTVLSDKAHAAYDPNHTQACELSEIDNGKMDGYVSAAAGCGDARNIAAADPAIIKPYWDLAAGGALADRYFQPIAGQSSSNDMYLARASYEFTDNSDTPMGAVGAMCNHETEAAAQFTDKTIGDLLTAALVPWAWFADGYAAMVAAKGSCPTAPPDCPLAVPIYPCTFDPSDVPFEYYPSTLDNPSTMKDFSVLQTALSSGQGLPAVSFVKALGYRSEHPGYGTTLSAGVNWTAGVVQQIAASAYGSTTLILLTYDEGGGYFDHVAPPAASTVDGKPYGTRVPLLAVGPFARKGFVSHLTMEHSSIVKFIEWNWLGHKTGQLGTRDAVVNNLGSLLDPATTGVVVPEN